jgi:hypothetical protein
MIIPRISNDVLSLSLSVMERALIEDCSWTELIHFCSLEGKTRVCETVMMMNTANDRMIQVITRNKIKSCLKQSAQFLFSTEREPKKKRLVEKQFLDFTFVFGREKGPPVSHS